MILTNMNNNYENLSYEELMKLLKAKDEEIEKINNEKEDYKKKSEELQEENERLKVEFRRKQEELNQSLATIEDLENKKGILSIDALNHRKKEFDTKSEKLPKTVVINEEEKLDNDNKSKKSTRGRKPGVKNINNEIPSEGLREIICDFTDEELEELRKTHDLIDFDTTSVVKLIKKPAVYEWVKISRRRYKDKKTKEIISPQNNDAFKKSVVTSSFVAELITNKTVLGIPMERQAKWYKSNGLNISTSSIAHYMMKGAQILEPLYKRLFYYLLNNSAQVIHCDETPIKILDNIKDGRKTSFMFLLTTSFWDYPIYIYDFSMERTTDNIETYLKEYNGYLTVDGYKAYDKFKKGSKNEKASDFHLKGVSLCWCHCRRYWVESDPGMFTKNTSRKESTSEKIVHLIDKLFVLEGDFKRENYTMEEIKEARNKIGYLAILNEIKKLASSLTPISESQLEKAVNYTLGNWTELTEHLNYGGLDLSNQIALSPRIYYPQLFTLSAILGCFFMQSWG